MNPDFKQFRRGFLLMDMMIGMVLLVVLATVLAVGVRSRQRGAMHLLESRAAIRSAEAALFELQAGANEPTPRRGVEVRVIDDRSGNAPAGHRWVRVEAYCNGRSASLVGLNSTLKGGDSR
ncbi:hypothetical protein BH09PLA1_BH09PLA1_16810 [soil metagenome]